MGSIDIEAGVLPLAYAHAMGRDAGLVARSSQDECPFRQAPKLRQAWLDGFFEGRQEFMQLGGLMWMSSRRVRPGQTPCP